METCSIDVHTLTSYARILDRNYVPARYPDAFTEGSPFEFYHEKTSQEALDCAEKICDFCITMGKKYE